MNLVTENSLNQRQDIVVQKLLPLQKASWDDYEVAKLSTYCVCG